MSLLPLLLSVLLASLTSSAHEDGPIALEPVVTESPAGHVRYSFRLRDRAADRLLSDADLGLTHERKVHLFLYDPALREYRHLHPEASGTEWAAEVDLPVSGDYFVWAQGDQIARGLEFTAGARLHVSGGAPAWPSPPGLLEQRSGADGRSVARLSATPLHAGQLAMLWLYFSRTDGSRPEITPYLGAFAHAVIVPEDGDELIHVHPMDGGSPEQGMLHLEFPHEGLYRVWVQFQDAGALRTVALAVNVLPAER